MSAPVAPEVHLRPEILLEARELRKSFLVAGRKLEVLVDANLQLREGEMVAIVAPSGAGKSTLLKILSRIVTPTKGSARIVGRLGALLEVGTGFHRELTGRENIFLYGSILGMSRREITRKFDEIIAFADIDRFLDMPVKRYSSGMYVRLAFAVAAHLEPEILIVDEVLAVGDLRFQKKCLGKMNEVSREEGRTVLFVSHNMGAVRALCHRGIVLKDGRVLCADNIENCIRDYERTAHHAASAEWNRSKTVAIK